MSRFVLVMLLAAGLFVLDAGAAAAAQRWRMPLPRATLVSAFSFDRAAPYVGGQRRGIDLRGVPGVRVVAACGGVVTYAGRVPGWGRGVSLRCGDLIATELGLASASVARGVRVWPGAVVGRLAQRGVLRLGARRVGLPHGYVDPVGLLSRGEWSAPPPVAPRAGRPARPRSPSSRPAAPVASSRAATAAVPAASGHPVAAAGSTAHAHATATVVPRDAALPWSAWAGLALLAAGAGGGGVVRRQRHGRGRVGMALAQR
ncbi:MAG: M23 family metallopeptidase [Solirubrobacterales bacterium]